MPNRRARRAKASIERKALKIQAKSAGRIKFACPVKIHASADGTAPRRFEMVAYTGEPLLLDGYKLPVVIDIASVDFSAQSVPALHQHDQGATSVVGQIDHIAPTTFEGLPAISAAGLFTPTDEPGDITGVVMKKHDAGFRWQASVGGNPGRLEQVAAGQKIQLNGREYSGPCFVARGFGFKEISFVVIGADSFTSVAAKSHTIRIKGMAMTFEQWALGFMTIEEFSALDESAKSALQKAFDASGTAEPVAAEGEMEEEEEPPVVAEGETETPEDEEPPPASAAGRKLKIKAAKTVDLTAQAAQQVRLVHELTGICAKYGNPEITASGVKTPLLAHALEHKWDRNRTELEAMRIERNRTSNIPAAHIKAHGKDCSLQALQGAMILRAGGKLDSPAYKSRAGYAMLSKSAPWLLQDINASDRNRYMEAAQRYDNYSMIQICEEACRLNRIDTGGMGRGEMIRAAFSGGGNLSNIFTTNVNAILLTSYVEFSDDTTVGWVSEQDVNDFKTNERPRVNIGDGLKKLPRGSEAEHTSYTDTVESYKIARYARQFVIDEQDAIDDNFSMFQEVPTGFGLAAARLRPDLVYGAVILANPTLTATSLAVFSDSNSPDNNLSGALSHATLSTARAKLALVRENSVNLGLKMTHLLVPPSLEDLAIELTQSANILYGADDETIRGADNVHRSRNFTIVVEPRIENGVVNPADETSQSGSSTAWYGIAAQGHTIEVGYLKGTGRAPQVRSFVLDQGRWGMGWDVKHDIGVKALDFKAMNKSA